jgi:uncharacterized membrane protein
VAPAPGLAFVFSHAAVSSFVHPTTFAKYFPSSVPASWAHDLLPVFALYETLLVLALLIDRYTYAASLLVALTLFAIVAANPDAFAVLFRNIAIACAALALAMASRTQRSETDDGSGSGHLAVIAPPGPEVPVVEPGPARSGMVG